MWFCHNICVGSHYFTVFFIFIFMSNVITFELVKRAVLNFVKYAYGLIQKHAVTYAYKMFLYI